MFAIDYFGRPAYLAQSPQFYKQTMVGVFERVYEVGPVFRAEPHDTARHLAQYTSLDAEFGFIADHRDVMAMLRDDDRRHGGGGRASTRRDAADLLGVEVPEVPAQIPELDFAQAQELIAKRGRLGPARRARPVPGRRALARRVGAARARQRLPVRARVPDGQAAVLHPARPGPARRTPSSFDLIFRGLELVTGGQRLHNHGDYLAALAARGQDPAPYAGYLQVFSHGMPPHGGFAIGLERWTARLTGAANVRQVTAVPARPAPADAVAKTWARPGVVSRNYAGTGLTGRRLQDDCPAGAEATSIVWVRCQPLAPCCQTVTVLTPGTNAVNPPDADGTIVASWPGARNERA